MTRSGDFYSPQIRPKHTKTRHLRSLLMLIERSFFSGVRTLAPEWFDTSLILTYFLGVHYTRLQITITNHTSSVNGLWRVTKRVEVDVKKSGLWSHSHSLHKPRVLWHPLSASLVTITSRARVRWMSQKEWFVITQSRHFRTKKYSHLILK